jgi:hypothetical protein
LFTHGFSLLERLDVDSSFNRERRRGGSDKPHYYIIITPRDKAIAVIIRQEDNAAKRFNESSQTFVAYAQFLGYG